MKVRIGEGGGDNLAWGYYNDYLSFLIGIGLRIRLEYLDFLRGREWEAWYKDEGTPVLFTSGNRTAIIKPMETGGV
jgi:hypothetical protein